MRKDVNKAGKPPKNGFLTDELTGRLEDRPIEKWLIKPRFCESAAKNGDWPFGLVRVVKISILSESFSYHNFDPYNLF